MKEESSPLRKIYQVLSVVVPSITFCIIFGTFLVTIVSRYIFRTPVTWSYEISVLGYIWTMFFGVGRAIEKDEHVVFSLVYDILKPRGQMIMKIVYNVALVILLVLCLVPCWQAMMRSKMVTGVIKMPYRVVFFPFMYMMLDIIVQSALNVRRAIREYHEKGGERA